MKSVARENIPKFDFNVHSPRGFSYQGKKTIWSLSTSKKAIYQYSSSLSLGLGNFLELINTAMTLCLQVFTAVHSSTKMKMTMLAKAKDQTQKMPKKSGLRKLRIELRFTRSQRVVLTTIRFPPERCRSCRLRNPSMFA